MTTPSQRRQQLLDEIEQLDRLQRGYLSKQYLKHRRDGQIVSTGPYHVLQHIRKGRKLSQRIDPNAVKTVQADLAAWKRFKRLMDELAEVTEQMTIQEREDSDSKKNAGWSRKLVLRRRSGL